MPKVTIRIFILCLLFFVNTSHVIVINNHELVIFYDDFDDNKKEWTLDSRYAIGTIQDGYFELASQGSRSDIRMQTIDKVNEENDFKVEAKIKIIGNSPFCNAIVWGTNAIGGEFEEGMSFGYNSRKEFIALNTVDWVAEDITDWEFSDFIQPDAYNIIKLRKKGEKYHFYINNQLVKTLPPRDFIGQNFGFHAANSATIHVDYFKVSIYVPLAK